MSSFDTIEMGLAQLLITRKINFFKFSEDLPDEISHC